MNKKSYALYHMVTTLMIFSGLTPFLRYDYSFISLERLQQDSSNVVHRLAISSISLGWQPSQNGYDLSHLTIFQNLRTPLCFWVGEINYWKMASEFTVERRNFALLYYYDMIQYAMCLLTLCAQKLFASLIYRKQPKIEKVIKRTKNNISAMVWPIATKGDAHLSYQPCRPLVYSQNLSRRRIAAILNTEKLRMSLQVDRLFCASIQRWYFGLARQWLELLQLNLLKDQYSSSLCPPVYGPNSPWNHKIPPWGIPVVMNLWY